MPAVRQTTTPGLTMPAQYDDLQFQIQEDVESGGLMEQETEGKKRDAFVPNKVSRQLLM